MTASLFGSVHGRTIQLDRDPGVAEGQRVEIEIRIIPQNRRKSLPGPPEGWSNGQNWNSAGVLAHVCTVEDENFLLEIQQSRQHESVREVLE